MKRLGCIPLLALVATVLAAAPTDAQAPVHNFVLPTFTKEGYRALLLRGGEARFLGSGRIDIFDMTLTVYKNDASEQIDTRLTSPAASFYTDRQYVEGNQGMHLIRDDVDMRGLRWSYDHRQKKVVIDDDVHVIFHAQLNNILQ